MSPRNKAIKSLNDSGYELKRHGSNHDIYYNPTIKKQIPLKRHDFNDNDLRYIEKEIKQQTKGS